MIFVVRMRSEHSTGHVFLERIFVDSGYSRNGVAERDMLLAPVATTVALPSSLCIYVFVVLMW